MRVIIEENDLERAEKLRRVIVIEEEYQEAEKRFQMSWATKRLIDIDI